VKVPYYCNESFGKISLNIKTQRLWDSMYMEYLLRFLSGVVNFFKNFLCGSVLKKKIGSTGKRSKES
jgi:hypothetical protein